MRQPRRLPASFKRLPTEYVALTLSSTALQTGIGYSAWSSRTPCFERQFVKPIRVPKDRHGWGSVRPEVNASFMSQRDHGIGVCRAVRRSIAGKKCHKTKNQRNAGKSQWVGGGDSKKQAPHYSHH
jgi:hypothetical protein